MLDASSRLDVVVHTGFAPGQFPTRWYEQAFELHCHAWPTPWEGQLTRDRFVAELEADHVDVLHESGSQPGQGELLAYVKWKATETFYVSRDRLSDPAVTSLTADQLPNYVCAYEITATPDRAWRGLGRRLLSETINRWEQSFSQAVFCTYSPKRGLTRALRYLAETEQDRRPALEAFAHRASAAASRHIDDWTAQLGRSLERFIREEIVPIPDERIMEHLAGLGERHGRELINGIVAAIGIAYNFVLRANTGLPACGPAAFHRTLGAEHWRQYAASAMNCADGLGLVDHWRYSHDAARRTKCAELFKEQRIARAQANATLDQLIVLA